MQVTYLSERKNQESGANTWDLGGENIKYYRNHLKRKHPQKSLVPESDSDEDDEGDEGESAPVEQKRRSKHYFTMSFKFTFTYANDKVFFAYSQPYTYT